MASWNSNAGPKQLRDESGQVYYIDFGNPGSFYDLFDGTLGYDFSKQFVDAYEAEYRWLEWFDKDINDAAKECRDASDVLDKLLEEHPELENSSIDLVYQAIESIYRFLCDYGADGDGNLY